MDDVKVPTNATIGDGWKHLVDDTAEKMRRHNFSWIDRICHCGFSCHCNLSIITSCCLRESHSNHFLDGYKRHLNDEHRRHEIYRCNTCKQPIQYIYHVKTCVHAKYELKNFTLQMVKDFEEVYQIPTTPYGSTETENVNNPFNDEVAEILAADKAASEQNENVGQIGTTNEVGTGCDASLKPTAIQPSEEGVGLSLIHI